MNKLPREIIKHEILPHIDNISFLTLQISFGYSDLPDELSEEMQDQIAKYNVKFVNYFISYRLCEKCSILLAAAKLGNKLIIEHWCEEKSSYWPAIFRFAANAAQLELIQWLISNNKPFKPQDVLYLICNNKVQNVSFQLPCDIFALKDAYWQDPLIEATKQGYLGILEKAHKKHIKMPLFYFDAAQYGHLHILQWAKNVGIDMYNQPIANYVAMGGHIHILEWLKSNNYSVSWHIMVTAARHGHMHVIKWAENNGHKWRNAEVYSAIALEVAKLGNIEILDWLWTVKYDKWNDLCKGAAEEGHLKVLQWAEEHGLYGKGIADVVAANGNVEILKWCVNKGDRWTEQGVTATAINGHINILEYMLENNGMSNDCVKIISTAAATNNRLLVLKWLKRKGLLGKIFLLPIGSCKRIKQWVRDNT